MAAKDYTTLAKVKAAMDRTVASDDPTISAAITWVSHLIDQFFHRPDGYFVADAVASARLYAGDGSKVCRIDHCTAVSLVEVKDSPTDTTYTAWAATDWLAGRGDWKRRPDFTGLPKTWLMVEPGGSYSHFTSGRFLGRRGFSPDPDDETEIATPTVRVTATWGYAATVPPVIESAATMQAIRTYKRCKSAMADAVGDADLGQLLYRQTLDPDVGLFLKNAHLTKVIL